jgi:hypothetical protein
LNLRDSRGKRGSRKQDLRRRDSEPIERRESLLIRLRSKPRTRRGLRLLSMLVFRLNKEWNKSVLRFRLESKQNKLNEK